jgi:predicted dithiol-disulfide oxidoreductase (DUF899 family)
VKREDLRLAEIELTRHRERVAAMRRDLPQGAAIQDYALDEGHAISTRVTRLYAASGSANSSPSPIARWSSIT